MPNNTQLIVGLGNPGNQYSSTRHNVGFAVVEKIVEKFNLGKPETKKNYELWIWKPEGSDSKIMLVKPLTFMNKSGEAVGELVRFFKIGDAELTIIHDDMDLEFGFIRLREGGASGGHNGVQSILEELGHDRFRRIKLGIGRPPENIPAEAFVLHPFNDDEKATALKIVDEVGEIVLKLVSNQMEFSETTIQV